MTISRVKKTVKVTYDIPLQLIKELLADHLDERAENIEVEYILETKNDTGLYADPRDNNSYQVVSGIKVRSPIDSRKKEG